MRGPHALRLSLLGAALAFASPAFADAALDDLVREHVMWRFDQQARQFITSSGARFVSSTWNGDTRTLIAVGEMDRRLARMAVGTGSLTDSRAPSRDLKRDHVDQICRHPMLSLITRFLEKYDVTMALVYAGKDGPAGRDVVEITHGDLRACV